MGLITKSKPPPNGSSTSAAPSTASSGGGGVKYICNVCSNDITSTVRVRCAHKTCTDYDLCVPCFSTGSANLHHDPRSHPYQVIEPHSIPIFSAEWGADEELLLLEGAEQYGLGSWADIADHIGGYREKDEVRDHYIETYITPSSFPLPERASPGDKRLSQEVPREVFQTRKKRRIETRKSEIADAALALSTSTSKDLPAPKPTSSVPSCHEVAGYMPGRLEFESEYFNEAEEAVQHMHFSPDEGYNPSGGFDPETELKIVVMKIYNDRLTARTDRKRVIFAHRLLEYRKNIALEKKRTKEQRELQQRLKPFARMMSHKDFTSFAEDLEQEQNLRHAISQLQDWRRVRVASLAGGEKYESEKSARLGPATNGMDKFGSSMNGNSIRGGAPTSNALGLNGKPVAVHETAEAVKELTTSASLPVRIHPPSLAPTAPAITIPPIPSMTPINHTQNSAPSWQLLLPIERELCSKLRLQPKAYMCIKDAVLRAAMQSGEGGGGRLKKKQVREIARVDTTRGGRVFEFLVEVGWVGGMGRS